MKLSDIGAFADVRFYMPKTGGRRNILTRCEPEKFDIYLKYRNHREEKMHSQLKDEVRTLTDDLFSEIVQIRRDFHRHPELSEHEERTAQMICKYLSQWGIEYKENIGGHGIVGVICGKLKPPAGRRYESVAVRADMDALPIQEAVDCPFKSENDGVMHACGHDIHMACLLGTAKILKKLEDKFYGTVKLFFQPAEETVGGAAQMIADGCMEDPHVGAVIAFHVAPYLPAGVIEFCRGKMNAATCDAVIEVEGISCHGAHPEGGIDAILAGAQIVTALQSIVSRNLSPTNPGIITIGQFNGGTKENIVAGDVKMAGTLRALDPKTMETLKNRVNTVVCGICQAYGAKPHVRLHDGYPALINDVAVCDDFSAMAEELFGRENICFMEEPSLGADDFSFFSQRCDGLYFNVGTDSGKEAHPQKIHSEFFNPDESCIKNAVIMEVLGVLHLLEKEK